MQKITVYTTAICPYCVRAKNLLKNKGYTFEEIDVSADASLRELMVQKAGGRRTVPQIFVGDVHVGGFDDLSALDRQGKLEPLVAGA
jgi:glutaredoxin 3